MRNTIPHVGEVWKAKLPNSGGRELYGSRPVIIVSSSFRNTTCPLIKVIPLSRLANKIEKFDHSSMHVLIEKTNNPWLKEDSIALCEQETSIDINRIYAKLGALSSQDIDNISFKKVFGDSFWTINALKNQLASNPDFIKNLAMS